MRPKRKRTSPADEENDKPLARKKRNDPRAVSAQPATEHKFEFPSHPVSFRAPTMKENTVYALSFPPTIYLNAVYSNGIRLSSPVNIAQIQEHQRISASVSTDYYESARPKLLPARFSSKQRRAPVLSPTEARFWCTNEAATSTVRGRFPVQTARLLGTITRTIRSAASRKNPSVRSSSSTTFAQFSSKENKPLPAMNQLSASKLRNTVLEMDPQDEEEYKLLQSNLIDMWKERVMKAPAERPTWNLSHGNLLPEAVNDPSYVPLSDLHKWIRKNQIVANDDAATTETPLHVRTADTSLESILTALQDLSVPHAITYRLPMIFCYPVLERINQTSWRLQIAIYAHRSLPLILTQSSVFTMMEALDEGSFRVTEPRCSLPKPAQAAFESCEYPIVRFDDTENDTTIEVVEEQDSSLSPQANTNVVDLTLQGTTREENFISAFSPAGLLKLLENTGSDISQWHDIQMKLKQRMCIDFMLHQQHAICWLLQMEQLGGFGVNSLLWEEREFLDGGKYYYSQALGQVQLKQPDVMKGGILCDEMGLGKTIEILGLVTASMDDVVAEAKALQDNVDRDDIFFSHTTLVIVPPALANQWVSEIEKVNKGVVNPLTYRLFLDKTELFRFVNGHSRCSGTSEPDIVVTTYKVVEQVQSKFMKGYGWGRVVLDEMQEIRSSATAVARNCDKIVSQRRWMCSGTPLFDGIEDLRGELNFLRIEGFGAQCEDGFFEHSVLNHWNQRSCHALQVLMSLGTLLLRRTKNMRIIATDQPLMGLPPLTVEFVPVPQRPSERALYCFLESLVASELRRIDRSGMGSQQRDKASRKRCLRLLRELCISPVLLNGGMGVPSQLEFLNQIMIRENRLSLELRDREREDRSPGRLSCKEAMMYLSVAQREARTEEGFVSNLVIGAGGGASNRNHAMETGKERLIQLRKESSRVDRKIRQKMSQISRARWFRLVDLITCGHYRDAVPVNRKVRALWNWRFLVTKALHRSERTTTNKIAATFLHRGWRPSPDTYIQIAAVHPDFLWADRTALRVPHIPQDVPVKDVLLAFSSHSPIARFRDYQDKDSSSRTLVVSLADAEGRSRAVEESMDSRGIVIQGSDDSPFVSSQIKKTKEALADAKAAFSVHTTSTNKKKLEAAKEALQAASIGFRICFLSKPSPDPLVLQLECVDPQPPTVNQLSLESSLACFERLISNREEGISHEVQKKLRLTSDIRKYERYESLDIDDEYVKSLSAFEYIQELQAKNYKSTYCAICLGPLGFGDKEDDQFETPGDIALTRCCHIYCASCLEHHFSSSIGSISCPFCRTLLTRGCTKIIDPAICDEKEREENVMAAKSVIQEASRLLATSCGVLDAEMWKNLYLSFDPPAGVSNRADRRLGAIHGHILQHFRAATSLPTHCSAPTLTQSWQVPCSNHFVGISSKVERLLRDLPINERCVIFATSTTTIKHLLACLGRLGRGYQALFSGQRVEDQQHALALWNGEDLSHAILVVQSGTAASGLTLTAANKMFFIEPFTRQEEEKQAYARCHRFGQTKSVYVKCYFAPVSVESRMLEWRKLAASSGLQADAEIKFGDVQELDSDTEEDQRVGDAEEIDEDDQLAFLLQEHMQEQSETD